MPKLAELSLILHLTHPATPNPPLQKNQYLTTVPRFDISFSSFHSGEKLLPSAPTALIGTVEKVFPPSTQSRKALK